MKDRKLLVTLAGAALISAGLLTTVEPNILGINNNASTVQAASRYRIRLRHSSAYYNKRGRRINGKKYVKKYSTLTAYGTRMIKHRRYYYIGKGRYIKAANAYRVRPARKVSKKATKPRKGKSSRWLSEVHNYEKYATFDTVTESWKPAKGVAFKQYQPAMRALIRQAHKYVSYNLASGSWQKANRRITDKQFAFAKKILDYPYQAIPR